jgi:hypothetical protein
VQATPQQQFAQAMPTALQIFPRIIPFACQIADRLVFRGRGLHRGQQLRAA